MSITTPLPPAPQTSDGSVLFAAKADAFVAALPLFQAELDAYAAGLSPIGRNMLLNGAFRIWQRPNTGPTTDDTYVLDRWYLLTQTNFIGVSQVLDQENGYTHAMRLTQSQATAQRFGCAQIVLGKNCKHGRGGTATLSGRVRMSTSTTLRFAILGWTGAEDNVTSDVVNNWTSTLYSAGNFFLASNISVLQTGSVALTANALTSLPVTTATLGSTFTNLIVVFWTDTAQALNVTLDFEFVQLETGSTGNPFERRAYEFDLALCQFYYQKIEIGAGSNWLIGMFPASTTTMECGFSFSRMRVPPTITLPGYGTTTGLLCAANSAGNLTGGTLVVNDLSVTSARFLVTGLTGATPGQAGTVTNNSGGSVIEISAEL